MRRTRPFVFSGAGAVIGAGLAAVAGVGLTRAPAHEPATGVALHGWCVNATSGVYLVLQGTGGVPTLHGSTGDVTATDVVALHDGAHLAYFPMPGGVLPHTMTGTVGTGPAQKVFVTGCSTTPPSTA